MKYFSMFSGIGGFEIGIQRAFDNTEVARLANPSQTEAVQDSPNNQSRDGRQSPTCIGYSEIDKYAIKVYERHFKGHRNYGELQADLDSIKTILSDKNYDILEVCYVNTVKQGQSFIQTTNLSAKIACLDTKWSGVKKILQSLEKTKGDIELCTDKRCLICTAESVSVVEKQKNNSLHSNTETVTDISTEKGTGQAICIASPSEFTTQKNTKSYATTVITLKGDTVYAHIKRTKPHKNWGDATTINAKELPDFDLLVGGFPCQAFSVAGKRAGFNDTRGTLFFDIARILKEKQPRHLVLENVKGLLSHDTGRTFQTILGVLSDLGYFVEWQVLNSKDFGVPQNRERVFIVGHLGGQPRRKVFPIESDHGETTNEVTSKGRLVRLTRREEKGFYDAEDNRASTLDANYYKGLANQERPGVVQPFVSLRVQGDVDKRKVYTSEIAATLAANPTSDNTARATDGVRIRRLTPLECERLMAYPDNWTKYGVGDEPISDTQRYKMCGNGVVSNVVKAVIERII